MSSLRGLQAMNRETLCSDDWMLKGDFSITKHLLPILINASCGYDLVGTQPRPQQKQNATAKDREHVIWWPPAFQLVEEQRCSGCINCWFDAQNWLKRGGRIDWQRATSGVAGRM
jgi:hypothetical protein